MRPVPWGQLSENAGVSSVEIGQACWPRWKMQAGNLDVLLFPQPRLFSTLSPSA